MADARCSCGFTEAGDETITDHLLEVFVPEDCLAGEGTVHEEVRPDLTCSCGLAATTPGELDAHFLQVFTADDLIGRDGGKHESVLFSAGAPGPRLPPATTVPSPHGQRNRPGSGGGLRAPPALGPGARAPGPRSRPAAGGRRRGTARQDAAGSPRPGKARAVPPRSASAALWWRRPRRPGGPDRGRDPPATRMPAGPRQGTAGPAHPRRPPARATA